MCVFCVSFCVSVVFDYVVVLLLFVAFVIWYLFFVLVFLFLFYVFLNDLGAGKPATWGMGLAHAACDLRPVGESLWSLGLEHLELES